MQRSFVVGSIAFTAVMYGCSLDQTPAVDRTRLHPPDIPDATASDDVSVEIDAGPPDAGVHCGHRLLMRLRDFKRSHPDFENYDDPVRGIVEDTLGEDGKPVYAHDGETDATSGPEEFNEWYRDIDHVNVPVDMTIDLAETSFGMYEFEAPEFFPLDGRGWRDEDDGHNFFFTTEIHAMFVYGGREHLSFTGDDDAWVFVNGKLVIDLGGIHPAETGTVDLHLGAEALGLEVGEVYSIDIFHAERRTEGSSYHIETSIQCFVDETVVPR